MAQPVKTFRLGFVSVAIFENDGPRNTFYTVKLQRSYKVEDGEYAHTDGLNAGDLLNAARLLQRAESWVSEQQEKNPR